MLNSIGTGYKMSITINLKWKTLDDKAIKPTKAYEHAIGYDLTAISRRYTELYVEYDTGWSIELPNDYFGILVPRSSVSKLDLVMANSVGIIDNDYRGSLIFRYKRLPPSFTHFAVGDKIGQLIILQRIFTEDIFTDELGQTERGEKGFGSTGK